MIIPYRLYQAYGDIRILRDNYQMMLKWMKYIENKAATEVPEGYDTSNAEGMKYQKYLWNTGFPVSYTHLDVYKRQPMWL